MKDFHIGQGGVSPNRLDLSYLMAAQLGNPTKARKLTQYEQLTNKLKDNKIYAARLQESRPSLTTTKKVKTLSELKKTGKKSPRELIEGSDSWGYGSSDRLPDQSIRQSPRDAMREAYAEKDFPIAGRPQRTKAVKPEKPPRVGRAAARSFDAKSGGTLRDLAPTGLGTSYTDEKAYKKFIGEHVDRLEPKGGIAPVHLTVEQSTSSPKTLRRILDNFPSQDTGWEDYRPAGLTPIQKAVADTTKGFIPVDAEREASVGFNTKGSSKGAFDGSANRDKITKPEFESHTSDSPKLSKEELAKFKNAQAREQLRVGPGEKTHWVKRTKDLVFESDYPVLRNKVEKKPDHLGLGAENGYDDQLAGKNQASTRLSEYTDNLVKKQDLQDKAATGPDGLFARKKTPGESPRDVMKFYEEFHDGEIGPDMKALSAEAVRHQEAVEWKKRRSYYTEAGRNAFYDRAIQKFHDDGFITAEELKLSKTSSKDKVKILMRMEEVYPNEIITRKPSTNLQRNVGLDQRETWEGGRRAGEPHALNYTGRKTEGVDSAIRDEYFVPSKELSVGTKEMMDPDSPWVRRLNYDSKELRDTWTKTIQDMENKAERAFQKGQKLTPQVVIMREKVDGMKKAMQYVFDQKTSYKTLEKGTGRMAPVMSAMVQKTDWSTVAQILTMEPELLHPALRVNMQQMMPFIEKTVTKQLKSEAPKIVNALWKAIRIVI